ncbi:MAG: hypothetical protein U1E05_08480, partial [Patescibacteria group bacterium]|nr:hypothetical protein [Patescibacteria group bacterium]
MSRFVVLSVLLSTLVGIAGCRSSASQGPVDPFLGPTRVPAPSTGSIYTPPADSYYSPQQNVPVQPGAAGPVYQQMGLPIQGAGPPTAQAPSPHADGGWSAVPSFADASLVAELATPDMRPPSHSQPAFQPQPAAVAAATVQREPIVRVLEPAPRDNAAPPMRTSNSTPTRVVNIVDLPRVASSGATGIRTVGAEEDRAANPVVPAVAEQPVGQFGPPAGQYGFDPSYAWLRGRLEYSQVDRRWKLRYIPVDGNTDQYGGSVV